MSATRTGVNTGPGPEHRYEGNEGTQAGYMGKCSCGWRSVPKAKRRSAQGAVAADIGQATRSVNERAADYEYEARAPGTVEP